MSGGGAPPEPAPAPSRLDKVTGSVGEAPVVDGTLRGLIASAISSVLGVLLVDELGVLDAEQMLNLAPAILLLSYILWGVWDRIRRRV